MNKKELLYEVIDVLNDEMLRTNEMYKSSRHVFLEGQVAGLITAMRKVGEMLEEDTYWKDLQWRVE